MATSKEDLVTLGREVRSALSNAFKIGTKAPVSTKEVLSYLAARKSAVLKGGEKDGYTALRILAEHGYPGARRGEPQQSRIYGKVTTVRPWLWSLAEEDEISAWITKMSFGGRSSAVTRDHEERIAWLEEQVKKLLASPAATVRQ